MPNAIGPTGLTTATRDELLTSLTASLQTIYGADIDVSSSSPDGQWLNIIIQIVLDLEDLLVQIYNTFDPDNAIGVILDQRVAINGIQRQAGTFTVTDVTIVTSQALNLYGLDQEAQPVYTVSDNAGNHFELQTSQTIASAGTYVLSFQAADPGAVLTTPNTITVPVTIVLGVTSINNPTTYTSLGINEESDAVLKVRRQKSVSQASQGYYAALFATLSNINGVTSVAIYENVTNVTDSDGVPGHSIWVIVAGTAAAADIAEAIYKKRNAGCGMKGDTTYTITRVDGQPFLVRWDDVASETLYTAFTATSIDGINPPDIAAIRSGLPLTFMPGVNEEVDINHMATLVQDIDPNCLVTNAGFSTSPTGPFTDTLSPTLKKNQFTVASANIIIIPMLMSPSSATVQVAGTQQFTALGGFGSYTWTMQVNNSGGGVSVSGLYTAGATPNVVDTVRATDTQGHFVDVLVTVTT